MLLYFHKVKQTLNHMKKILPFLFFSLCLGSVSIAQECLPEGIKIVRQGQIDSFSILYPGCTFLKGSIELDGSGGEIINLHGLAQLKRIGGGFSIHDLNGLNSLAGLDSIGRIDGAIDIYQNPDLHSCLGLNGLTYVGKLFHIRENMLLQNLSGLEKLDLIGGHLWINNNPNLLSIVNLVSLDSIGGAVIISENHRLKSLEGLHHIRVLKGNSNIFQNDSLLNYSGLRSLKINKGDLTLRSNQSTINFIGFDSLTTIYGYLSIADNHAKNLDGFEALDEIWDDLYIDENDSLLNLEGLDHLRLVKGTLWITDNPSIISLSGLSSLREVGSLQVKDNLSLQSFSGLENLTSIKRNLNISRNDQLVDITGLSQITTFEGDLTVFLNKMLPSIRGLDHLNSTGITNVNLLGSEKLTECAIESICNYLYSGGPYTISGNDHGCNTREEIITACLVAVKDPAENEHVTLSPNPTTGVIEILGLKNIKSYISVFNSQGMLVRRVSTDNNWIDISDLSDGMYLVSIPTETGNLLRKLIKCQ